MIFPPNKSFVLIWNKYIYQKSLSFTVEKMVLEVNDVHDV